MGPGDVIVVSPGEPHQTRNTGPGELVSLCFFPVPDLAAVTTELPGEAGGGWRAGGPGPMSADVLCLRPEADFREVGVQPPADLRIRFAAGPDEIPDADLATARAVVLASVGPALDRAWADRAARVELVQFTGAGVDRGAAAFTGRPGLVVANVPAANAREVAEYVLLATGSLLRGLALADREIRAGRYREVRGRLTPAAVRSLHSATVGVVGLGQIGLAAARLFQAVVPRSATATPPPATRPGPPRSGWAWLDLDDLLATCDVVTLHVPLTPATRGLIGWPGWPGCGRAPSWSTRRGAAWWTRPRWPPRWTAVSSVARSWTCTRRSRPRPLPLAHPGPGRGGPGALHAAHRRRGL